jgi:glycerophosphoryl diester phosphodiesterase
MKIIEQSLIPKNPQRKSEDGIVVTNDFIAVIDGSTSKAKHQWSSRMSNGRYAMTVVSQVIRKMAPETSCHQFCLAATRAIHAVYTPSWYLFPLLSRRGQGWSDPPLLHLSSHPEERLCASAVIYSNRRREIWLVGDCQCLVGGELCENPKPYEQRLAEMRAAKVQELLAAGKTPNEILADDQARAAIIPEMLREMQQQNKTYAVIDGFPIPETRVSVIVLDFRPWEIVLASDGYPFLCPTLAESEARLDEQRRNDPLNIGDFKATKGFTPGNNSFDDRTYIRFSV